jgi:Protein of unknown function (DUF3277)
MPSTTYSFKDTSGSFTHPLTDVFAFAGQIGMGQFTVSMTTEKSNHDVAADGAVMVSAVSGDNGTVSIEVQQTSALHTFLLAWYNTVKTLLDSGDVTTWASATLTIRNIVDGSTHVCRGISPSKVPDKTYAAQGGRITWQLLCADIQNLTL